jgi:F-type H+-transporting ATPase subunit b
MTMHHEESFFADPRMWVVIAFILFFILFGKKIWGALANLLDARAVAVKAELEEASRLRREAESMLRDAQKQRTDALADAKALIEGARTEAARSAAAAAEAESSARRREQMAIDRIAAAEKAAVDDVRLTAADVATAAARQVLAEGLTADADARLIDQAITQLPAALAARRAA